MRNRLAAIGLLMATLTAPASAKVTGRLVTTDGAGVAGVSVNLYAQETIETRAARIIERKPRPVLVTTATSADGSFTLDPGVEAVVDLEAAPEGYAPLLRAVDVSEGLGIITLRKVPTVTRRVMIDGKAAAKAAVTWTAVGSGYSSGVDLQLITTAQDGSYKIADPKTWAQSATIFHPDAAVQFSSNGDPDNSLTHELSRGTKLEGRVLRARNNAAVEGAVVYSQSFPVARSGADGRFVVPHLAVGDPYLFAVHGGEAGIGVRKEGQWTILLSAARTATGTVSDDATGRPLAGARVMAYVEDVGTVGSALTDAKGRFEIKALPAAHVGLYAGRPGYSMHFSSEGSDGNYADLRLKETHAVALRLRRDRVINGVVNDVAGKPVGGAFVWLAPAKSPAIYGLEPRMTVGGGHTRTDPNGHFSLTVDAPIDEDNFQTMGGAVLIALKAGHTAARSAKINFAELKKPVAIVLTRGEPLVAIVRDSEGKPVRGASIAAAEAAMGFRPSLRDLFSSDALWPVTGEDGKLELRLNKGMHDLAVRAPGFALGEAKAIDPALRGEVEIVLEKGATIGGKVLRGDGRGAAGIGIYVENSSMQQKTTTAADGTFSIGDLPAGPYVFLAAKGDEFVEVRRTVTAPVTDLLIELAPSASLRGTVRNNDGRPVDEFTVRVKAEGSEFQFDREIRDASGKFEIKEVPFGLATLTVSAPELVSHEGEVTIGERGADVEVSLQRGFRLYGRVSSPAGEPLPDTSLQLFQPGDHDAPSAVVDAGGEFSFSGIKGGKYSLNVNHEGFAAHRAEIELTADLRHDVVLSKGLSLAGVVYSEGVPVSKARIYASSSTSGDSQSAESNASGEFVVEGLTEGRYSVNAQHEKSGSAELSDVEIKGSTKLRIDLKKPLTGRIFGQVSNLPSDDAGVRYVYAQGEKDSDRGMIDPDGTFRLEKVPAGSVTVTAFVQSDKARRSSRPKTIELAAGSEQQVNLEFSNDIVVRGMVTRGGGPVLNANLTFAIVGNESRAAMTRADAHGRYEIAGLDPGNYEVQIYDALGGYQTWKTKREIKASTELNFDVTGGTLTGRVVDAETRGALKEAMVRVWRVDHSGEPEREMQTDARGGFSAKALPDGRYRVVATLDGYGQESEEVDLYAGSTREVAFALRHSPGLKVFITDARDGRVLNGFIVVRDRGKRMISTHYSEWGSDGGFTLPLAAGSYLLSASAEGYGSTTTTVTAPSEVKIAVSPGGTLIIDSQRDLSGVVKLVDSSGEEYVRCWCNGISEMLLQGKRTTLQHITPGRYTLQLYDQLGAVILKAPVDIREGQSAAVTVE